VIGRRHRSALAGLFTLAALTAAGPASAAGPYEPFSEGDPRERSTRAVERLNDRLIPEVPPVNPELLVEEGVVVRRTKRGPEVVPAPAAAATKTDTESPTGRAAPESGTSGDGLLGRAGLSQPADQPTPDVGWLVALAAALALAAAGVELRRMRLRGSL
jgi:hypothetical protein